MSSIVAKRPSISLNIKVSGRSFSTTQVMPVPSAVQRPNSEGLVNDTLQIPSTAVTAKKEGRNLQKTSRRGWLLLALQATIGNCHRTHIKPATSALQSSI
jgi:hypothetical protein